MLAFGILGFGYADTKSNGDPYKVGIKKPKTGGFIGGEFGFGSAYSYADVYIYQNGSNYYTSNLWGSSDHTAIPINVFGGYQWYFYDRPWFHFGVRVRGHIGYSNYNTDITPYLYWAYNNANLEISSHAIQYGVEAQFLWDFLNIGEHTLGWHFAPIGLEGSTFFGKITATGGNSFTNANSADLKTQTKFSYIVSTGLHYYYNARHMVFATYRSRYYGTDFSSANGANNVRFRYYTYANHIFMLGYAYKF